MRYTTISAGRSGAATIFALKFAIAYVSVSPRAPATLAARLAFDPLMRRHTTLRDVISRAVLWSVAAVNGSLRPESGDSSIVVMPAPW